MAAAIEEALHAKFTEGAGGQHLNHQHHGHGYNEALRHLVYNFKRSAGVRGRVLSGEVTPAGLLGMGPDDFLDDKEKDEVMRKGRHATFLSATHTFSEVLFEVRVECCVDVDISIGRRAVDEPVHLTTLTPYPHEPQQQEAAAAGTAEPAAKCKTCGSTKVLFGRRQTYNESSTWYVR